MEIMWPAIFIFIEIKFYSWLLACNVCNEVDEHI